MAGFTTERDLGTEGAGYADVGLKQAIDQGIVPGPRLLVATKAIVARGAYGPKGFEPGVHVPQGAEEVSGRRRDRPRPRATRSRPAPTRSRSTPTITTGRASRAARPSAEAEMAAGVAAAHDAGRLAAAHATTAEGMRRAILAGVDTIEHGYGGTTEVFKLMHDRSIALCPTHRRVRSLRALFPGLERRRSPRPRASRRTAARFQLAMKAGVPICMGGDVGVFTHGKNWLRDGG